MSKLLLTLAVTGAVYAYPAIAEAGCNTPVIGAPDFGVDPVYAHSSQMISITYHDQCGAEDQTRIYVADAIEGGGWQLIQQDGYDSLGWRQAAAYGLDPGGRYCFEVEVDGSDGVTRRSERFCTHTSTTTMSLSGDIYDEFYDRMVTWRGIDVISSSQVSYAARNAVLDRLEIMVGERFDLQERLRQQGAYAVVIGVDEETLDLPECEIQGDCPNRRGFGGVIGLPITAVGEENLLNLPQDSYLSDIFTHEFGHSVENLTAPEQLRDDIIDCYDDAIQSGLWPNTYAATNAGEYWAVATEEWFDNMSRREQLRSYDRCIYDLVTYTYDPAHLRTFLDPHDPAMDLHLWQYNSGRLTITGGRADATYGAYVWEWDGFGWTQTWVGWHLGVQALAAAFDGLDLGLEYRVKVYRYSNGVEPMRPAPSQAVSSHPDRVGFSPAH